MASNYDIFLAHAGADDEPARQLYEQLRPSWHVFLDNKSLLLGDRFDVELPKAHRASRMTVVLVSERTEAAWFQREEILDAIEFAREPDGQHRVVPVYLDDRPPPYGLRRIHSLYLSQEGSLAQVGQRLDDLLRGLAEPSDATVKPTPPALSHPEARSPKLRTASSVRLPTTNKELFGRESELAWLDACWRERVHLAVVIAWGGFGKSALVNAWLARLRDKGWEGAASVFAWSFYTQGTDNVTSSDEFVSAALHCFGDRDPAQGSPWDRGQRLAELVRKERAILILDGLEPLQWGAAGETGKLKDPTLQALLTDLGLQNTGLCVVTSRLPVRDLDPIAGEKISVLELPGLSPEAGADLLRARGASGSEEELRRASDEYKGHGLALTLLGSYLAEVANGDIQQRDEIALLEPGGDHAQHARRVMAAYMKELGEPELALLQMIGLFDRPASKDEIAALLAEPVFPGLGDKLQGLAPRAWSRIVNRLQKVSLVLPAPGGGLDAHPLVREFFGDGFAHDRHDAWQEGHRRLYEHLKNRAPSLPSSIEEMASLYEAVIHGCLAGKSQEALDEIYWTRMQRWNVETGRAPRENEHYNQDSLGAFGSEVAVLSAFFDPPWDRLTHQLRESSKADVLTAAGVALWALGRMHEAAQLMRFAVEQYIKDQAWESAAVGASKLAEVLQARGELEAALVAAERSVELARRADVAYQMMANWTTRGASLHALGRFDEARIDFERAEQVQARHEPDRPFLYSLWSFRYCELLLEAGEELAVLERAAHSARNRSPTDSLLWQGLDHLTAGRGHLVAFQRHAGADLAEATRRLDHAVSVLHRAGYQDYLAASYLVRAELQIERTDWVQADRDLEKASTIAARCGLVLRQADLHLVQARRSLAIGDCESARRHLDEARPTIAVTGYRRRLGELSELDKKVASRREAIGRGNTRA